MATVFRVCTSYNLESLSRRPGHRSLNSAIWRSISSLVRSRSSNTSPVSSSISIMCRTEDLNPDFLITKQTC